MSVNDARVAAIVPYTDVKKTRAFYEKVLGLELYWEIPNVFLMYLGGSFTTLSVYYQPAGNKAEHTQVGFEVDNIEDTVATLTKNGVVFEQYDMEGLKTNKAGIAEMDGNRVAFFKDPAGNTLSVMQMTG